LATANLYRFSSKEIHVRSGMYYYLYRFYDPNLQRWINRDRLGELGGVNLYGLLLNSPMSSVDPFGLVSVPMPPNPGAGACCEAILEFLKQLARHVRGRYNDLLADKQFLYKNDAIGYQNHINQFNTQRDRLDR